jgi:hypothetical protein
MPVGHRGEQAANKAFTSLSARGSAGNFLPRLLLILTCKKRAEYQIKHKALLYYQQYHPFARSQLKALLFCEIG